VNWPLPENWGDQQIEQALFPQRPAPAFWRKHPEPDWVQIHQELQTHKDLTLQLVWQEGRENDPDGYAYSRFCDLYRRWLKKLDLVLRQEHRAGEKMFVDYAGATIPVHDPQSGAVRPPPCSWRCWAPAVTPSPKPPPDRICGTGSVRICGPSSFSAGGGGRGAG